MGMGRRPEVAALCCLWSLVSASGACRSYALQQGWYTLAANVLHSNLRDRGPPHEASIIAACGLLAALAAGPRINERTLGQLNVDVDAVMLLQRFLLYQRVVSAAFVLVGVLARDTSVAARLSQNRETVAALEAAMDRWPDPLEVAAGETTQPMAPVIAALLRRSTTKELRSVAG